jgi:protein-S-isoprenylcysteine O-methyltransferase Ste14
MTDKKKSLLLVTAQFILLAVIFLVPTGPVSEAAPAWVISLGSLMVWPGLGIVLISIFKLGQSLTASPIPKENAELKTDGLYKWMRHPIYTGLMLTTLGIALEAGSVAKLLFVAALMVLFDYKAKYEESFLIKRFPEYRSYMSSTGRFVPRLNR